MADTGVEPALPPVAPTHQWVREVCRTCGLRRAERWVRDERGRAVMALTWTAPQGYVVRVRPFPPMLGLTPESAELLTVEQLFPGVTVGPEPACPGERGGWVRGR